MARNVLIVVSISALGSWLFDKTVRRFVSGFRISVMFICGEVGGGGSEGVPLTAEA